MVFLPGDEGPFWMTAEQRQSTRLDVGIQGKTMKKKLTKEELTMKFAEKGIIELGNITNVKRPCAQQGIPVESEVKKIQHGWEGSAKGMLQVLWEQGFINVNNLKQYTVDGRNDAFGNLQYHTSLKYLL